VDNRPLSRCKASIAQQQLALSEEGPVVLVNLFTLDAADEAAFLETWAIDAAYMKAQPGFMSTQLHRALGSSPAYLNYAVWETMDAFRAAFSDPGFQAKLADYPASASIAVVCGRFCKIR
jgi:heme-degrading monooxygenase HmoA